jgi:hypothetical protein
MVRTIRILAILFSLAGIADSALAVPPPPPPPPPPPSGPPPPPPGMRGAPGPIVGAGLPVLVVGYGVYWLIRRRRQRAITDPSRNREGGIERRGG